MTKADAEALVMAFERGIYAHEAMSERYIELRGSTQRQLRREARAQMFQARSRLIAALTGGTDGRD